MKSLILAIVLALSLSACKYDNTFVGTLDGAGATMTAFSKNTNKFCIALNIQAGAVTKKSYISAQSVVDENDLLKPMSFNSKGAECGQDLDEYLVGNRNTNVLSISVVTERESYGPTMCILKTYKRYQYREDITLEMKNNATDATTATFKGTGEVSEFTDRAHPVSSSAPYYCRVTTVTNPYPYNNGGVIIGTGGVFNFGVHIRPRRH